MSVPSQCEPSRRRRHRHHAACVVLAAVVATLATACGGGAPQPVAEPFLVGDAARGKQLISTKNCLSCHTVDGRDGPGPTFNGAYRSTVTLTDGSKVVVDDAYLINSIKDPWSQKVKGYNTIMPRYNLDDADVTAIVAYLKAIGRPATT